MKTVLLILLILCAASAAALPSDTVYFGRQTTLGNTSGSSANLYGEAASMYQFEAVAGYTYVLKRVYMYVKNYTNDTSSLSVGLYTVDPATGYPDDSVWSVCRQMSAEEQTGSEQWIYSDCDVALTVGVTYCWASGENTNGMLRIYSTAVDTTGGLTDTAGTDHDIFPPLTVSRYTTGGLAAQWTHGTTINSHPVIYGLVERTASEAPSDAGARVIIISE